MRNLIYRAMHQSDDLVVTFDYTDSKGAQTHRVVSPIRFLGRDRFLALCLSREEPRQFYLERCHNVRLAMAADFLMPVAILAGSGVFLALPILYTGSALNTVDNGLHYSINQSSREAPPAIRRTS